MGKGNTAKGGQSTTKKALIKGVPPGIKVTTKNASGLLTTIPEHGGSSGGRGSSGRPQGEELLKDPMAALFGTVTVQEPEEVIVHKVKKAKKPKLTKEEKEFLKLEHSTNSFMNSGESYNTFIERIDNWLLKNYRRVVKLFTEYDIDGDGELSYEEFKLGMADVGAPCNQIELHALCKLIDADGDGTIDISEFQREFENGIQYKSRQGSFEDGDEGMNIRLTITKESLTPCPKCGMGLWKPKVNHNPSFVRLHVHLLTFTALRKKQRLNLHGSFIHIVDANTLLKGVVMLIAEKTGITSRSFELYRNPRKTADSKLTFDMSLVDCGWRGGPRLQPEDVNLYYDYAIEGIDCPLLLCQSDDQTMMHLIKS